jgi:putative tryptophan/tyrosine transport system substrate-binding protein
MMECWTIRLKTFFQHSNIPSARMFWLFCAMLFALCSAAEAQHPAKIPRIGFLAASSAPIAATRIDAFRQGLRALGYVEGKDIAIEFRFAEGKPDQLPHYAAELVRLKVDIIITLGPMDTRAARDATKTIPIVMGQDSDPVGSGVVASLARPGGNITGLSSLYPEITGKQLELLKENVPTLSRVAVLGNSTEPGNALLLKEMELASGALKVQLKYLEVRDPTDIETAFSAIRKDRADAVIVLRNPIASTRRQQIVDLAAKSRLPAIYVQPEWVEAGGLMSYAPDLRDNWRRAATYVDKILKGANPAELPVEQPTKFELVINLKAAKQISLTIPQRVLLKADKVIK